MIFYNMFQKVHLIHRNTINIFEYIKFLIMIVTKFIEILLPYLCLIRKIFIFYIHSIRIFKYLSVLTSHFRTPAIFISHQQHLYIVFKDCKQKSKTSWLMNSFSNNWGYCQTTHMRLATQSRKNTHSRLFLLFRFSNVDRI